MLSKANMKNTLSNIKELLFDLCTPERFSVRVIGRIFLLKSIFSRFFKLPRYLIDRDENIKPHNISGKSALESSISMDKVVSDLRKDGCSETLNLSDPFSYFLKTAFH